MLVLLRPVYRSNPVANREECKLYAATWSTRDDLLAVGGSYKYILLYVLRDSRLEKYVELEIPDKPWVKDISWSPDSNYIPASNGYGGVLLGDINRGKVTSISTENMACRATCWIDYEHILLGGQNFLELRKFTDNEFERVWRMDYDMMRDVIGKKFESFTIYYVSHHNNYIYAVGHMVMRRDIYASIFVTDRSCSNLKIYKLKYRNAYIVGVGVSTDHRYLRISERSRHKLIVFETRGMDIRKVTEIGVSEYNGPLTWIGRTVLILCDDPRGSVSIYRMYRSKLEIIDRLRALSSSPYSEIKPMSYNDRRDLLAVVTMDNRIEILDTSYLSD